MKIKSQNTVNKSATIVVVSRCYNNENTLNYKLSQNLSEDMDDNNVQANIFAEANSFRLVLLPNT